MTHQSKPEVLHQLWMWIRTHILAIVVFAVLTVLLFQPEGQQEYVDVTACILLGIASLYLFFFAKPQRTIPPTQLVLAGLFICYGVVSIVWTDDISNTVSTLFRYGLLFLTYLLWYIYSTKQSVRDLFFGIIGFGIFAIIAAIIVSTNFDLIRQLPSNSLLYSIHGHHPLITLLLFAFPIAFFYWIETKKPTALLLAMVFLLASVVTFSRSGVAIEVVGIWTYIAVQKTKKKHVEPILVWIAVLLGALCVLLYFFPYSETNSLISLLTRAKKTSDVMLLRGTYTTEALAVIRERPWTGSGLGTFYLESLRFEPKAFSFSWLPHCLPLQHLSDLGIVGTAILWLFIGSVIWNVFLQFSTTRDRVTRMVFLTGIFSVGTVVLFSFVDIPFLYLTASLLVWSILGALGGVENAKKHQTSSKAWGTVLFGGILCLSAYTLYVPTWSFWIEGPEAACNPMRVNKLFVCLQNAVLSDQNYSFAYRQLTERIHVRQRQILLFLAAFADRAGETEHATQLCHTAMWYDPFSTSVYYPCWRFFVVSNQYPVLGREVAALTLRVFPQQFSDRIRALHLDDASYYPLYGQVIDEETPPYGYTALLYRLGLASIDTDPNRTEQLWRLVRDINPDNGHFHVEYADLLRITLHRPADADQVLVDCQTNLLAAQECKEWMEQGISQPGRLEPFIREGK